MKISNNVNNTTLIITKNDSKVQEENRQTNEKRTAEQSVKKTGTRPAFDQRYASR